jgi:hypothetical protein
MIKGFSGWVLMRSGKHEAIKTIDTAITVVATLLVATTWAVIQH